jgi:hypothetical protein
VLGGNAFRMIQVSNGSRHTQHAIMCSR